MMEVQRMYEYQTAGGVLRKEESFDASLALPAERFVYFREFLWNILFRIAGCEWFGRCMYIIFYKKKEKRYVNFYRFSSSISNSI